MPIFHFKVTCNDQTDREMVTLEFADMDAAWDEATVAFGELVSDAGGKLIVGSEWAVEVYDEQLRLLRFIRVFSGQNTDIQLNS